MADAILSVVVEQFAHTAAEQIRKQVNLVRGVDEEILNLSNEQETIRNVLDDAYNKEFKDKSIKDWLKSLEETSYEMSDVLDEWNIALLGLEMEQSNQNGGPPKNKVLSCFPSSCLCFKKVAIRHDIANKVEKVKAELDSILAMKDRYGFEISQPTDPSRGSWRPQSTSEIYLEEVSGRKSEGDNLVSKLVAETQEELGIHAVSIVGEGGLGKTTLAQLAYNDSRVKNCFELRIWICVSDPFDEVQIAKGILEGVKKGSSPDTDRLEMLLECLRESISGKKFLLVLDDVWSEDDNKWEPLKNSLRCGGPGSKILVTTRNEVVAIMIESVNNDIIHLEHLSDEECWLLLSRRALSGKSEHECEKFENIGRKIANKCKGLPLAAKTLGGLLRFKKTLVEWDNVLNSEIWGLEEVQVKLFPHLLLSYNELSPALKKCFSYCSVFPKDTEIEVEIVITQWMALGYLGSNGSSAGDSWEDRGKEYFDKIAMRSLFQDFKKGDWDEQIESFKMHDILHDFAQFVRKNDIWSLKQFPQGIAELTSLRTLSLFRGGRRSWSKLAWLKSLNRLSGSLGLKIELSGDDWKEVVEDGREAELRKKVHIQSLRIDFWGNSGEEGESVVLDALEPHPNLQNLVLDDYCGSQLPGWIVSPVNQLRSILLYDCEGLLSLWPLPKLPFLEEVLIVENSKLELVGGEFLGIRRRRGDMDIEASSSSSSSSTILFPKLKVLVFHYCPSWKKWEDITAEEEDSALVSIMPCLTKLEIVACRCLTTLPHRLLRKVSSSLEELRIYDSDKLIQVYGDKEGEGWKSISHHNPRLNLTNSQKYILHSST